MAVTALSRVGVLAGWETRAVDTFLFFRDRVPAPEIALVVIDEEAFRELRERQPLSRRYLADLGEFLLRSGARVVAFDILLTSRSVPEEDAALVALARHWEAATAGRVVFASLAVARKGEDGARYAISPPFTPELHGLFGFSNAPVDADGVIRRLAPVLPAGDGGFVPSFSLSVLAGYRGQSAEDLAEILRSGAGKGIPLPGRDSRGSISREDPISLDILSGTPWRIDFAGSPGAFTPSHQLGIEEIAGLSLQNGLVVLSGCETAVGEQVPGAPS